MWILLIVLLNGTTIEVTYQDEQECRAAALALIAPVLTNLNPDADAVRQTGFDAYCIPATTAAK
jgi:hypothetical protein